jgi:hypothetical protein
MTDIDEILRECKRRDIRLYVEAGSLQFDAPSGAVMDDLMNGIKANRADLLHILSPEWLDREWCLCCEHQLRDDLVLKCRYGDEARRVCDLTECPDGRWAKETPKIVEEEEVCCPSCRGTVFWSSTERSRICKRCHPPAPGAEAAVIETR